MFCHAERPDGPAAFHYPARYDHINAYKLAGHQHVCEIEQELGRLAGGDVADTYTDQVVPACRGNLSTLYAALERDADEDALLELYRDFYADDVFVRVLPSTAAAGTVHVRGTNFCNLVVSVDRRTGMLRVVSHIDNLMKGASGSAVQCMNLMFGFEETLGLEFFGLHPI